MKCSKLFTPVLLSWCILFFFVASVEGDFAFVPIEEQVSRADLIVVGTVAEITPGEMGEARKAEYLPHVVRLQPIYARFQVDFVIKGHVEGNEILLKFMKIHRFYEKSGQGEHGGSVVSTDPRRFSTGEHCLLFLEKEGDVYRLNEDRHGKNLIENGMIGLDGLLYAGPTSVEDASQYLRNLIEEPNVTKNPKRVRQLVQMLSDKRWMNRLYAAQVLGRLRAKEAVSALGKAAYDSERAVRTAAVFSLGRIGTSQALEQLISLLKKHKDSSVRHYVIMVLPGFRGDKRAEFKKDRRALKALLEASSKDPEAKIRAWAIEKLRFFKSEEVFQRLLKALTDEEPEIRRNAAVSLGAYKDKRAIPPLLAQLNDQDADVRCNSGWALSRLQAKEAIEPLAHLLQSDERYEVRSMAVYVLGALNAVEKADVLILALSKDANHNVRSSAAIALGELKVKEAIPALEVALQDESYSTRNWAKKALQMIRGESSAE